MVADRIEAKRAYDKAYYQRTKAQRDAYQKGRREQARGANRASYARHRLERLAAQRLYLVENPERRQAYLSEYYLLVKAEAMAAYGGAVCVRCGDTEIEHLTLDHVNGDGSAHRLDLMGDPQRGGKGFYIKLRKRGWPKEPALQVLCRPCNYKKYVDEERLSCSTK